MELKWLEDFIAVANRQHFARAASDRYITQSAISRRIQALESWVGTSLLDRSQNPVQLTPAGEEYLNIAKDLVERSYEGRATISRFSRIDKSSITIGCLHTLTLNYLPELLSSLYGSIGKFSLHVIAEVPSIEEHISGLQNRSYDFFICYAHDSVSINLDSRYYPHIDIDQHWIRPYQGLTTEPIDLSRGTEAIDYLEYASTTYMTRVISQLLARAPFRKRLSTMYRSSLAESLLSATSEGIGISWLPDTIFKDRPEDAGVRLVTEEWNIPLNVRVYRLGAKMRPLAAKIWEQLENHRI
ncbi:DNA-binding transcriptional regulator, LysR family [Parasphingorhabdus marina DSM 22363]|uniref:DNA-binding transcriptional regulator, LysR family n=1 Tax=Parasphingorhabdus marina DSM 22363 TaxID=1123272 RepID=A0A1N6D1T6_9SPHN|nr:LysR family transcriptional regulator [Parasphingorhabdus marina]SIN64761.1 DNA-binding transcriptional regulator, LysR family [Parasphingorhabdus marina DSM 22363]